MTTDREGPAELEDPVLEARIQHALKPYVDRLTPKALAESRRILALVLTTHPVAARLMERLRERSAPGSSGVMPTRDSEASAVEEPLQLHGDGKQGRGAR